MPPGRRVIAASGEHAASGSGVGFKPFPPGGVPGRSRFLVT